MSGCVVGVTANRRVSDDVHWDVLRRKYIDALVDCAGVEPIILPTVACHALPPSAVFERLDGLLLTGDESNLDAAVLGGANDEPGDDYVAGSRDVCRDRLSVGAIRFAIGAGMPILAICRGLQELNVYFGGTLEDDLADRPGGLDHREDVSLAREAQYAPVHEISLRENGVLHGLIGRRQARVNSLHGQGIRVLGEHLAVEAQADDGLIEAISTVRSNTFQLGVQWHPEWNVADDPVGRAIFERFGVACREYHERRG